MSPTRTSIRLSRVALQALSTSARLATLPLAALTLAALTTPTNAQITTFNDRASFNAATSNLTTIDFNNQGPFTIYSGGTATLQGVTFTATGNLFAVSPSFISDYNLGDDTVLTFQTAQPNQLTVALPTGTTAFGLNFGNFDGAAFTFNLSTGDVFSFSSSAAPTSTPTFAGFISATPLIGFRISSVDSGAQIDRLSFGATAVTAAPEPGSIALLLTAGVPVVGIMRRRKK